MTKSPQKLSEIYENLNKDGAVLGLNLLSIFMIGYLFVSIYCFNIYADDLSQLVFCGVTFGFLIKAVIQLTADISGRAVIRDLFENA